VYTGRASDTRDSHVDYIFVLPKNDENEDNDIRYVETEQVRLGRLDFVRRWVTVLKSKPE